MLSFFSRIEIFSKKIIEKIENSEIGLMPWILTFFCIVFIRGALEAFSSRINIFELKTIGFFFLHAVSFYPYVFLALILFLYFLTKEKIEKITKVSLFVAPLLLLPAIADTIISGGAGVKNAYFLCENMGCHFWKIFFANIKFGTLGLFAGPGNPVSPLVQTANYGIRIECLILALLIIYYIFLKTKSPIKIALSFFLLIPYLDLVAGFPLFLEKMGSVGLLNGVSSLSKNFNWNEILFSSYFILVVIFASVWFFIYQKGKFLALIKNFRFSRTLQILALLIFGLYLAHVSVLKLNLFDFILIITAGLSLTCYWGWAVLNNDVADEKADAIDSPDRPLPSGLINREEAKSLSTIFLIAAYISALAVGYAFFIALFIRSCLAYIYSNPPFNLKRIPLLSTFVLGLAALTTVVGSYLLVSSNSIYNFPISAALLIVIAFALGFTAKDIKDYKGDEATGVKTLPVIFGLERGKKIIGMFSFLCFLLPPVLFHQYFPVLIGLGLVFGSASYYLMNRKEYSERPLLLLYFLYAVPVVLYLFR